MEFFLQVLYSQEALTGMQAGTLGLSLLIALGLRTVGTLLIWPVAYFAARALNAPHKGWMPALMTVALANIIMFMLDSITTVIIHFAGAPGVSGVISVPVSIASVFFSVIAFPILYGVLLAWSAKKFHGLEWRNAAVYALIVWLAGFFIIAVIYAILLVLVLLFGVLLLGGILGSMQGMVPLA